MFQNEFLVCCCNNYAVCSPSIPFEMIYFHFYTIASFAMFHVTVPQQINMLPRFQNYFHIKIQMKQDAAQSIGCLRFYVHQWIESRIKWLQKYSHQIILLVIKKSSKSERDTKNSTHPHFRQHTNSMHFCIKMYIL